MGDRENISGDGPRKRASAIRGYLDDLDRARADLVYEILGAIRVAIDDATGDDPSASASAFHSAEQTVKRVFREYAVVGGQALRVFLQAFSRHD